MDAACHHRKHFIGWLIADRETFAFFTCRCRGGMQLVHERDLPKMEICKVQPREPEEAEQNRKREQWLVRIVEEAKRPK